MTFNEYHLDWVQYTLKSILPNTYPDSKEELLSLVLPDWIICQIDMEEVQASSGLYGYKYSYIHTPSKLRVMFGHNTDTHSQDLGVNVTFSGSSLRFFCPSIDLEKKLGSYVMNFSNDYYILRPIRVDVCLDCNIPVSKFDECITDKHYRCASRDIYSKDGELKKRAVSRFINDENTGTIYIGDKTKSKFLRIYDKILERRDALSGEDLLEFNESLKKDNISVVTRLELSCHNKGAGTRAMTSDSWASILLDMFLSNEASSVFMQHFQCGEFSERDQHGNPVFVAYGWYVELITKGLFCSIRTPEVQESAVNLSWYFNTVLPCVKAFSLRYPDLLRVMWQHCVVSDSTLDKFDQTPYYKFLRFQNLLQASCSESDIDILMEGGRA